MGPPQVITDRHGQCLNCEYENAYQCRQCRNINHEQLDALLCNECGWSRYGRFDFAALSRPHYGVDNIMSEEDRLQAFSIIATESEKAHAYYSAIKSNKTSLLNLLSSLTSQTSTSGSSGYTRAHALERALFSPVSSPRCPQGPWTGLQPSTCLDMRSGPDTCGVPGGGGVWPFGGGFLRSPLNSEHFEYT